ncbi:MAG: hypothetical protein IID13_02310 [Candidatus Marinimicrobia bacterium]|nr:hypothetical protein [Candidatus Neomarinimicrobiota bacterium]
MMISTELEKHIPPQPLAENPIFTLEAAAGEPVGIYPNSIRRTGETILFMGRQGSDKSLWVFPGGGQPENNPFAGTPVAADGSAAAEALWRCPLSHANAVKLRELLPFTKPVLLGIDNALGLGDRLGLAGPGHLRAMIGSAFRPMLAQQSIRELERTERTPEEVLDAATWAVLQEGYTGGFGADADHLKTTAHLDMMAQAGYTMFTIDPGEYVLSVAEGLSVTELRELAGGVPWETMETTLDEIMRRYSGKPVSLTARTNFNPGEQEVLQALVKYGGVIGHCASMIRYFHQTYPGREAEFELSVDETDSPTTPFQHFLIVSELARLGIELVSLAPRFVGDFEKGIDYKGDIALFKADIAQHMDIAEQLGPYKVSFHSGSDKFRVYEAVGAMEGTRIHLKTAGTSYLEALRVVARHSAGLFREILDCSRAHYLTERHTYHVSARLERVPAADDCSDRQLPDLLDRDDSRQVLHVSFGSVLVAKLTGGGYRFRDRILAVLEEHEETHYDFLCRLMRKHLRPLEAGQSNGGNRS